LKNKDIFSSRKMPDFDPARLHLHAPKRSGGALIANLLPSSAIDRVDGLFPFWYIAKWPALGNGRLNRRPVFLSRLVRSNWGA
jgi:hypothetical protein